MNTASVRKSVLSLLLGIAEARGLIDLDLSLGELGLAGVGGDLTEEEARATLRDLVMARSGVYLPAAAETDRMQALRPPRGSAAPGTRFHYNNWDFNMLGLAFERETGLGIGQALEAWLAVPLGLEDFDPAHAWVDRTGLRGGVPAYRMFLSARDLARIGLMVAEGGRWNGVQVVPEAWIDLSLTSWSEVGPPSSAPPFDGYGYSWWIDTGGGAALAWGWGGQYLHVDRQRGRVLVMRRDTGRSLGGHLWFLWFGQGGARAPRI